MNILKVRLILVLALTGFNDYSYRFSFNFSSTKSHVWTNFVIFSQR
jgi:hypothetical protein